jgi:hypothetical protein
MPRYFFHLCRDGARFNDDAGQTLRDPDQAWEAARATALHMMDSDPSEESSWSSYRFEVTDESGQVLLEFPFLEASEIKSQPS